jgi:hypothetical protein
MKVITVKEYIRMMESVEWKTVTTIYNLINSFIFTEDKGVHFTLKKTKNGYRLKANSTVSVSRKQFVPLCVEPVLILCVQICQKIEDWLNCVRKMKKPNQLSFGR